MSIHTAHRIAFASLLTACCQPRAAAPPGGATEQETASLLVMDSRGEPAAWAVVDLRDPRSKARIGFFKGNEKGEVLLGVAPGVYNFEVTTPRGFSKATARSVGAGTPVELSSSCEATPGRAHGDIAPGDFVWLRNVVDETYYGAQVRAGGEFAACIPRGSYAMDAHDDEKAPPFVFESGSRVDFAAYAPTTIDAPPPEIAPVTVADSLAPFVSGGVRIIGIGEANHGTHEFLTLRVRETLRLARTAGVRFVALEAGPAEVFPLDDYVHDRLPDVAEHVARLGYWMWDTKDMLASLAEIRQYNRTAAPDAQVSLVGIDVQHSGKAAEYLLGAGLTLTPEQRSALDAAVKAKTLTDLDANVASRHLNHVLELRDRGALPFRTRMALEQLTWRLRMYVVDKRRPPAERELGMAALVEALETFAGDARIVIWAHNTHVATDPFSEYVPLGSQLRARIGTAHLAVGVLMGRGTIRAWDPAAAEGVLEHSIDAPTPASLEAVLARIIPKGVGFVRLRELTSLSSWLETPRRTLENGGVMPADNIWPLRRELASFDIVGFVAEVTPTSPTPTGERRATK